MERDRRLDAVSHEVSCGSAVPLPQAGGHSLVVDKGAGVGVDRRVAPRGRLGTCR
jgi:hypothetical protein